MSDRISQINYCTLVCEWTALESLRGDQATRTVAQSCGNLVPSAVMVHHQHPYHWWQRLLSSLSWSFRFFDLGGCYCTGWSSVGAILTWANVSLMNESVITIGGHCWVRGTLISPSFMYLIRAWECLQLKLCTALVVGPFFWRRDRHLNGPALRFGLLNHHIITRNGRSLSQNSALSKSTWLWLSAANNVISLWLRWGQTTTTCDTDWPWTIHTRNGNILEYDIVLLLERRRKCRYYVTLGEEITWTVCYVTFGDSKSFFIYLPYKYS